MRSICAVVVTYNRLAMLKQCFAALTRQTTPCDILVVDNASDDGTGDWLSATEGLSCIRMAENTGGAGGFHAGVKEAVLRGYEYIWLMDDDCLPAEGALEKLMEADSATGGHYGWLSSVALWTDGRECRMNRQKLLKAYYEDIHLMQYGLIRAEQATFVSLFLRAKVVRRVGLPIKEFFIWGDDIEYTRRITIREKLPCYVAGQSLVTHAMKENTGSNIAFDSVERLNRYNLAFRNENYLYRQEGFTGLCYFVAKRGRDLMWTIFRAKNYRWKRCGIIIIQMFAGLAFNPQIEYIENQ